MPAPRHFFLPFERVGDWEVQREGPRTVYGHRTYVVRCTLCAEGTVRTLTASSLGRGHSTGCGCRRAAKLLELHTRHGEAVSTGNSQAYGRFGTIRKTFRIAGEPYPDWCATFEAFRDATPFVPAGWTLQRIDKSKPWALDNMEPAPLRRSLRPTNIMELVRLRDPSKRRRSRAKPKPQKRAA